MLDTDKNVYMQSSRVCLLTLASVDIFCQMHLGSHYEIS
jgi:hypothetical protein